jgi:mRNA interferase RelE/StbE
MYKILWDSKALDDLRSLDKQIAVSIVKKLQEYLVRDPVHLGKPLTATYKGLYRYRYGDYRIIYEILSAKKTVVVTKVGHRSKIYE